MHQKRKASPKILPIKRKGTKYIAVPSEKGVSVLIVLRDVLGLANNRKEVKSILNSKIVKVNGVIITNEKQGLKLFDVISLKDKNYRVSIRNKKYSVESINEKESKEKITKIINKKMLNKGKIQINLSDGRNYLTDKKYQTGDSVVINLDKGEISKVIPLKEKSEVFVNKGKHLGKVGIVEKIHNKLAEIKTDSEKIIVNLESLIALK